MRFHYIDKSTGFNHEQEITPGKAFYVIGSTMEYRILPDKLRYTIEVQDEGITVCQIRFNDADLANMIGEQLTRLIGSIYPDMNGYANEPPF